MKSLYDIIKGEEGYEASPDQGAAFVFRAFEPPKVQESFQSSDQFEPLVSEGAIWGARGGTRLQDNAADAGTADKEAIREQAAREAADVLESAKRNAELIEREAYEKGYKQGEVAGEEIGKKKYASAIRSVESAFQDLVKAKTTALLRMEPMVVELSLAVARKAVHGEILLNPDVIVQNLRASMEYLVDRDIVTVRLNPSDHKHAASFKDQISQAAGGVKNLLFEPDPAIARGGALVVTEFGELDARVEVQLEEIENSVRRTLIERTPE